MSKWLERLDDINSSKKNENEQGGNCQNRQNSANSSFGSFDSSELAENKNNSAVTGGFGSFGSNESRQNEKKYPKHIFSMWQPVQHLKLLAGDKSYILGFIAAKQFDNYERYDFLCEYAKKWEEAADRQSVEYRKDNTGRKAANGWLLEGGK